MEHLKPAQAHTFLADNPDALFIDCRSNAEFRFVGHPLGAIHVAWLDGVDWVANPHFVGEVRGLAGDSLQRPIVMICRSGKRSADAASALEQAGFTRLINVEEGFEGDLDESRQRGKRNGWRFAGLPWEQQ